jgi:bifunctional ADP-heptose synthase (sugar kinase/adenylyltransferase)
MIDCTLLNDENFNRYIDALHMLLKSNKRILVIGDTIVDTMIRLEDCGESPEGKHNKYRPIGHVLCHLGGAFNIARYARQLCSNVLLVTNLGDDNTVYGKDTHHKDELLRQEDIQVFDVNYGAMTEKTRYVDSETFETIARIDDDTRNIPLFANQASQLLQRVEAFAPDVLIVQNYGKGLLVSEVMQKTIDHIKKFPGITSLYGLHSSDPIAPRDYDYVRCNEHEYDKLHECDAFFESGSKIIFTNKDGMFIGLNSKIPALHRSLIKLSEARNVCGAGDLVTALLGVSLPFIKDLENNSLFNIIPTLATMKCDEPKEQHHSDIHELIAKLLHSVKGCIVEEHNREKFLGVLDIISRGDFDDLYFEVINGRFEYLHVGHVTLFDAFSDDTINIVAVNDDASFKRLKKRKPVIACHDRMYTVSRQDRVNFVMRFNKEKELETILHSMNSPYSKVTLIKGIEYKDKPITGKQFVTNIRFVPMHKDIHVSKLK